MKTMHNMSRQTEFLCRQNVCKTVSLFSTYIQHKKPKSSETSSSFPVKVKLSTFVCIFLTNYGGNCARVMRLTAVEPYTRY